MNKITTVNIQERKKQGKKITMLTCYDYSMSKILNEAGIDILLVGDSLGMVVLGYENTLPVTVEEILHHTKAVKRGNTNALLVADMPFMSYQVSIEKSIENAARFIKEGGAEAVKLEGGEEFAPTIQALIKANIPVMGHLGLTPQAIHKLGGHKVQGRDERAAKKILSDAKALEKAGIFSLVLECVPEKLAKKITQELTIPTIGIGAGRFCDGQVLVTEDLLGLFKEFVPKFVKRYARLNSRIRNAVIRYKKDVKSGKFPTIEQIYS